MRYALERYLFHVSDYLPKIGEKLRTTIHNFSESHPKVDYTARFLSGFTPYSDYLLIHKALEIKERSRRKKNIIAYVSMSIIKYGFPLAILLLGAHPEAAVGIYSVAGMNHGFVMAEKPDKSIQTSP